MVGGPGAGLDGISIVANRRWNWSDYERAIVNCYLSDWKCVCFFSRNYVFTIKMINRLTNGQVFYPFFIFS